MHQTRPEDIKDVHKPDRSKSCTLQTIKGSKNEAGGQFPHSSRCYVWRTKCSKRSVQGQLLHCRRQGAGDSRHQGWLHAAQGQTLQKLWNEVNFKATEQQIKNIFYQPISPRNTTCAEQRRHCEGKEKLRRQQRELDSETRATCTLQKMEPACMAEPS